MTTNSHLHTLSFSINHWDHLYSLHKAIQFNQQQTGRELSIRGNIRNHDFLHNQDCSIALRFLLSNGTPGYTTVNLSGEPRPVLGNVQLDNDQLSAEITVGPPVFEELRKNLMEYGDIEGIHIVVSIGVLSPHSHWQAGESLPLLEMDYAMKGDA